MDRTFVALLLMKSMTSTAGDMPKSTSTWPESRITPPGAVGHAWTTPCCSRFLVVYDMTRGGPGVPYRSEEHTSELQSRGHLVCRPVREKKKNVSVTVAPLQVAL